MLFEWKQTRVATCANTSIFANRDKTQEGSSSALRKGRLRTTVCKNFAGRSKEDGLRVRLARGAASPLVSAARATKSRAVTVLAPRESMGGGLVGIRRGLSAPDRPVSETLGWVKGTAPGGVVPFINQRARPAGLRSKTVDVSTGGRCGGWGPFPTKAPFPERVPFGGDGKHELVHAARRGKRRESLGTK